MRTFDAVIPYLKKSWGRLTIGLSVLVIVDALQVFIPRIIQRTVDSLGTEGFTRQDIVKRSLMIVGIAFGIVAMRYIWRTLIIGNSHWLEKQLREKFYTHLMRLSQGYFNFSKIGDLMALATNDLNAVRMLFGIGLIAGADIFLMATLSFAFMIRIDPQLTLLAILPMPVLSFMIWYEGKLMHKRYTKVQASYSRLSGMIQESLTGIRVIKAFAQEQPEVVKMQEFSEDYVKENVKLSKIDGVLNPFMGVIISVSIVIVLIFGGIDVINGKITIGGFIAFFSYLGMLTWPMIAIGWVVTLYQRGSASLKRLNKIYEAVPEIADITECGVQSAECGMSDSDTPIAVANNHLPILTDFSIKEIMGNVEIRGLRFGYITNNIDTTIATSPFIFDNISTSLKAGQTLAICGRTGVGKTTLVDLLCRVYNPPPNCIFIDGNDIHKIPITLLRQSIVMVPQDIFLFSDTIANNIALGSVEANNDMPLQSLSTDNCQLSIEKAAKLAAVYDDIMAFDKGFETIVGERGVTLSGGQKQRIAIARALLTNPKILILDDALSAVDTKTEREILNNLIEYRKDKTNIIIAHRISAMQHADNIIVIENGTIVESGTHDELVTKAGIYNELYEKQKIEERIETSSGDAQSSPFVVEGDK